MLNPRSIRRRHRRGASGRRRLKRLLPGNLFGRALLILVLPMLLSQLFIAHIFYDRHWDSVERNMANSVVGDLVWISQTYHEARAQGSHAAALAEAQALGRELQVAVSFDATGRLDGKGKTQFPELYRGLKQRLDYPFSIRLHRTSKQVLVRVRVEDGALVLSLSRKLVTSPTTLIFILWMAGSSLLLTTIAILFLRNQIKPIVALAHAAEQLGLGQDVGDFKPRGASEVRRAGRAFIIMAERLRRQIQNRTDMLAGISHDLRTPLTRMKLELELATMPEATRQALSGDIDAMGSMIDEYLNFARGDAGEAAEPMDVNALLADIVADYRRSKRAVVYEKTPPVMLMLRPHAMRRALTNLIDNALRYGGGHATVALEQSITFVRIKITDSGPGIPESEHETVFKPFTRLEPSRNSQTGGVGLGLSIARSIAHTHGGDITLENQRDAQGAIRGLEVTLRLPRAVHHGI
ncbi:MAG: ATP-binding protein [Alphaproteobacteria bacterium]|nr:ATP-binding protein [Alphaproteobacteria bacterium]